MQFQKFNDAYLENLRRRDPDTEEHFVSYFSDLIHLKLYSRIKSKDAIEDVRQETFARTFAILHRKESIRDAPALGSLVNSVCNLVLLEHYRSCFRSKNMENISDIDLSSEKSDALDEILSKDTQKTILQILDKLTERDRQLLKRVFLEECDRNEICDEFGIDRTYLRILLYRAKLSFRSFYEKQLLPRCRSTLCID